MINDFGSSLSEVLSLFLFIFIFFAKKKPTKALNLDSFFFLKKLCFVLRIMKFGNVANIVFNI